MLDHRGTVAWGYRGLPLSDLLQSFLNLKFFHLAFELSLVSLSGLLSESLFASLECTLLVESVLVLLLRFHNALLSLLLARLIESTFLKLFDLLLHKLLFMSHNQ